ncbi:MAG: glycerol-3-phosphate acyltransferase [Gemmatimonadetes bacterium]|nr:glycerol-3-phosphate acyltransferase [Gemmatimonadota bacterium]NNM05686.1 glycerol-3-phosphate acyltransferase [Gemmatimonadota bacterium]
MDNGLSFLLAALVGYLVGSISPARFVGRRVSPGEDLSKTPFHLDDGVTLEYQGVSATSVAMRTGAGPGCTVSMLDMVKGVLPVLALRLLFPGTSLDLVAGAAVIAGHNFPIWHRLKGGRGMSPLFGVLLLVDWTAIPATMVASSVVGLVILADPYLSYVMSPVFLIPWFWWRFGLGPETMFALAANVLYWVATVPELRDWISYRRTHPRSRRERLREYRKGFVGLVLPEKKK